EAVEFKAAGAGGKHGIACVFFMPDPPRPRPLPLEVRNMVTATDPDRPGQVTLSWTTSWPCPTRLRWSTGDKKPQTVEQAAPCLVHRVVLQGLDPATIYEAQALGEGPQGEAFAGEPLQFRPTMPRRSPQAQQGSVPLVVNNPHPFEARSWPVTGGVPFAQGCLASADCVRLTLAGDDVPVQVRQAARWPDGSVKWLLVTFMTDVPPNGTADYRLEYGPSVRAAAPTRRLQVADSGGTVRVDTGGLQFTVDSSGDFNHAGVFQTVAENTRGNIYRTAGAKAEITVEETGPLRAVIKTVAPLLDAQGNRLFRIEKRFEAYSHLPLVRIHHTLVVDGPDLFTAIRRLEYQVPVGEQVASWQAALAGGGSLDLDPAATARQQTDQRLLLAAGGNERVEEAQLVGSLVPPRNGSCAVAVRDAWQNYPKGFSFTGEGLRIELCPPLEKGDYDRFPFEKEGHHLYYYLLEGCYRLKQGVAKTDELLLCFGSGEKREQICQLFQEPPILVVSPEWVCDSKVFYDLAPRDPGTFPLYEQAIDRNLDSYAEARERQHDFGMLNYGDWYGERGTNWGNVEYDTQNAFFLQYVRSGDPRAFFLGCQAELHNRDVDTVHAAADATRLGGVYVHQMCHVGNYYDKAVDGSLGFPSGGFTVSHAWTEGHFAHYFLTGDRRSLETGRAVADFFIRSELGRPYDFSSARTPGWHLIMLCSAYHSTGDPYYLNAARVVIDQVLELQDKLPRPLPKHQLDGRKPFQEGGWVRAMVPGHCECELRHQGNAGFMIAVLLSGMKYYHDITGDPRVKESIVRGAHYLLDETYSDQVRGFRYTSCPKTSYSPGASPLMVEAVARAYLWTGDDRFRRVLTEALPRGARGSGYGKGFSMYYRMGPRVLADLKAAGIEVK
ncbi:MAG: RIFT barrel domain-containing protein, partial [Thermoguttaceae bacterium]